LEPALRVDVSSQGIVFERQRAALPAQRHGGRRLFNSKEAKMKLRIAATGLALLAGVSFASAQTVIIEPEQEVVIREYVQKRPLASIALPGVELNIGSTIPEEVELHAVEVPDVQYEYVVVDNRTVLVEPGTRRIVRVYD
jgi:hypothetical protein